MAANSAGCHCSPIFSQKYCLSYCCHSHYHPMLVCSAFHLFPNHCESSYDLFLDALRHIFHLMPYTTLMIVFSWSFLSHALHILKACTPLPNQSFLLLVGSKIMMRCMSTYISEDANWSPLSQSQSYGCIEYLDYLFLPAPIGIVSHLSFGRRHVTQYITWQHKHGTSLVFRFWNWFDNMHWSVLCHHTCLHIHIQICTHICA